MARSPPPEPDPAPPGPSRVPGPMAERADLGPRLLAAVGYAVFMLLVIDRVGQGPLQALDRPLLGLIPHRGPIHAVSGVVTHLGDRIVLAAITLLGILILLLRRAYLSAGLLALAGASEVVIVQGLKLLFARARPVIGGPESGLSFPSGHATGTAMVLMLLAVLLFEQRRKIRPWAEGVAIGVALVVGFTRLVLGDHWPTDVVAGWGLGWGLAGTFLLFRMFLQRKEPLPHVSPSNEVAHSVSLSVPKGVDVHNETRVPLDVEDVSEKRPLPRLADPLHAEERGSLVQRFVAGEHGSSSCRGPYNHIGDGR